jgi:hypothetical protein
MYIHVGAFGLVSMVEKEIEKLRKGRGKKEKAKPAYVAQPAQLVAPPCSAPPTRSKAGLRASGQGPAPRTSPTEGERPAAKGAALRHRPPVAFCP